MSEHTVLVFKRKQCLACRSCELACAVVHSATETLTGALEEDTPPRPRIRLRVGTRGLEVMRCLQCKKAHCVEACESGALFRDPKTGVTTHDAELCRGCWQCVEACPHDAIWPDEAHGLSVHCDLCNDRRDGLALACVRACPTGALVVRVREKKRDATG